MKTMPYQPQSPQLQAHLAKNPRQATAGLTEFRVGTVRGIFHELRDRIEVISIANTVPHNGDFPRALDSLERRARKKGRRLVMKGVHDLNPQLARYLREQRNYLSAGKDCVLN